MWISSGLILGVVGYGYLHYTAMAFAVIILTLLVLFFVTNRLKHPKMILYIIAAMFFCVGIQLMDKSTEDIYDYSLEMDYSQGDIYRAEVLSISSSTKTWNKAILRVNGVEHFGSIKPMNENVLFFVRNEIEDVEIGDQLYCTAHIFPIENNNNPGEFDSETFWKTKGITQMSFLYPSGYMTKANHLNFLEKWFVNLDRSLSALFETKLKPEAVGVAKAIILGDRDHLDAEALRSFGNAGAMHVLAVSGLHVGLILTMLIFFFSRFPKWISKYRATVLALLIIWFYALITGFSPSVFRAVVMFSMLTLAKISGRDYNPINVLAASAFVLVICDPVLVFDLGFQLSYLAMLGIFVVYPSIKKALYFKSKILRWIWEGTSVALAAQLFTFPLVLYCFHQFPNYFLLSNIGLMVFTNIILVVGVLFIVLHKIPIVSFGMAGVLSFLVLGMFYFVQWIDHLPASVAKGFVFPVWEVLLLYGGMGFLVYLFAAKKKWRFEATGIVLIAVCGLLVFQRMKVKSKDEFVIFNSTYLTMALKYGDKIYCFYENDDFIGKSIYLAETYEKTKESEIEYIKLDNDKETILKAKNLHFKCRFETNHYNVNLNGKHIQLTKFLSTKNMETTPDINVFMPWLNDTRDPVIQLKKGAFVYEF
ncbi:MAG: ComEC/Rec2 family competence protein [Flavobacteriales bacterium]